MDAKIKSGVAVPFDAGARKTVWPVLAYQYKVYLGSCDKREINKNEKNNKE